MKLPITLYPSPPGSQPFYKAFCTWRSMIILAILLLMYSWLLKPLNKYTLMKKGIVTIGTVSAISKSFSGKGALIQSVHFTFRTNQGKLIHSSFISPYGLYHPINKEAEKVFIIYLGADPMINQDQHSMPHSMSEFFIWHVGAPLCFMLLLFAVLVYGLHEHLEEEAKLKLDKSILAFD